MRVVVIIISNLLTSCHSPPAVTPGVFSHSFSPVCLFVQCGESALQIAVRRGHLDVVKVLVQVYRDSHMEREVDQHYMDLAGDYHREDVVEYLTSEFPSLNRKVRRPSLGHIYYI